MRFDAFDERAHRGGFMRRQVVHDDDVAGGQRRQNERVDTGDEGFAVHRPVEHQCRDHAGQPQRGDAGRHLPVSVRRIVDEPSPRGARPRVRVMLVAVPVSSMKTSFAGSTVSLR